MKISSLEYLNKNCMVLCNVFFIRIFLQTNLKLKTGKYKQLPLLVLNSIAFSCWRYNNITYKIAAMAMTGHA